MDLASYDFTAACRDLTMFEMIFTPPPDKNIDMTKVQDDICGAEVNFTLIGTEIMENLAELSNFIDAVSRSTLGICFY